MKKYHFDQLEGKLYEETIYDPTPIIEANKAQRNSGERVKIGKGGQALLHVARIPEDHIIALRNMGYDLYSPDREEVRRALLFVQAMQNDFMTMDGKVIADRHQTWA